MSKPRKILTGQQFGLLSVLQDTRPDPKLSAPRNRYVLCQCACGRKTSVRADHLRAGHTRSCGCKTPDDAFNKALEAMCAGDLEAVERHTTAERAVRDGVRRAQDAGKTIIDAAKEVREKEKARLAALPKPTEQEYRFGLAPGQYAELLAAQDGVCAICDQPSDRALCVDHCHTTGKIRGLLCRRCNLAIGLFRDNIMHLARAVKYLAEPLHTIQ